MKNLLLFAAFLLANYTSAQCPYFSSCPTVTSLYCDYSTNDTLLWKAAPYTWNSSLMLSDLPESDVDLSIVVLDSCGVQNITVEYTLFLDLDGNDTAETVIRSNALPPSGKVLYNNILSPNYVLGDTLEFDHSVGLPDSMKYRFGLELERLGDSLVASLSWTTGMQNLNYFLPQLPYGNHRIEWRIEQGGVEGFCEYSLEVKDCAPPVVSCVGPFSVNIYPIFGLSILNVSDFLLNMEDNITPVNLLSTAFRLSWQTGTGFPVDINGAPITSFNYDCGYFGLQEVTLWVKDLTGQTNTCITYVNIEDNLGACGPPEGFIASALTSPPLNQGIEAVRFHVDGTGVFTSPFSFTSYSDSIGLSSFFNVSSNSNFVLTPYRNDNPLNGVTTFDLVLTSKHILGVDPFDSPFKMVAADANRSGSVTTFDVVEIRKLILGLYDSLPNNSSWRFIDKQFQFPNPQNPFQTAFPESIAFQNWMGIPNNFVFTGIKVGDVNNTAIPNISAPIPTESRASRFLAFPNLALKAGETIELPLLSVESDLWSGFQFGLSFNPELLEIESVVSIALPDFDSNNWAQPRSGQLNMSWSSARTFSVLANNELLRVQIKALADMKLSTAFTLTENSMLVSEAYDSDASVHPLKVVFLEKNTLETAQVFAPQPNPTTAGFCIPIQLTQAEDLHLEVLDLNGKLLWADMQNLGKGSHSLEIPGSAMQKAGIYAWRLHFGEIMKRGKITKM